MVEQNDRYLTYAGLRTYDEKIKNWVSSKVDTFGGAFVGYYDGHDFYAEAMHAGADPFPKKENCLYVDLSDDNRLYIYREHDDEYVVASDSGSTDVSVNETTIDCGGIPKGTDLSGKNLQQILEMMFSPYIAPSNISLVIHKSATYIEQGGSCEVTKANVYWKNGSVPVTSVTLSGAVESTSVNVNPGSESTEIDFTDFAFSTGTLTFTVTLHMDSEHTDVSVIKNIENSFVYPMYYGASNMDAEHISVGEIQNLTKVISSGNQTLSYTTDDSYPIFVSTRPIIRVTDELGITDYTSAFTERSSLVSLSSVNPTWGPQDYHVYSGSKATLNGFKFIFSFNSF